MGTTGTQSAAAAVAAWDHQATAAAITSTGSCSTSSSSSLLASLSSINGAMEITKRCQSKGEDSFVWAVQLFAHFNLTGTSTPSIEFAHALVSHILWENNLPIAWKYLEQSMSANIISPTLALASISSRVIPCRWSQPAAYRLWLELLKRYAFSFFAEFRGLHYQKTMEAVDDSLHLSKIFSIQDPGPGGTVATFIFAVVLQLIDSTMEDDGLLDEIRETSFTWTNGQTEMNIDNGGTDMKKGECLEKLWKSNTLVAVDVIGQLLKQKISLRFLKLASQNLPMHWKGFVKRLEVLQAKSTSFGTSSSPSETLILLSSLMYTKFGPEVKLNGHPATRAIIGSRPLASSTNQSHGSIRSAIFIPLDLFLEDAMDGSQVAARSAIEVLTDLVKSIQIVNGLTWYETFMGLWVAALCLVQRARDSIEGPVPRLDARLCILLSITPLAILDIIEEEEARISDENEGMLSKQKAKVPMVGLRRKDLITSIKVLGGFDSLLAPLQPVVSVANRAAAKAMLFVSGLKVGSGYLDGINADDVPHNCVGNMRHLIVEACIARGLLDTTAYFWPGYVNGSISQVPQTILGPMTGWTALVKGTPFSVSMVNPLMSTPASSLAELEKIFDVAVNSNGSDRIYAASVLCGASLTRGWTCQEHTVLFVVRLLSLLAPTDYQGDESHLIGYAPVLHSVLTGISSVDSFHVFSLHGMVPQLAGALMVICEVFGSSKPSMTWNLPTGGETSVHMVFSTAFVLLMRLWRFNFPPLERCVLGKGAPVGSLLTPEYLLLLRNSQVAASVHMQKDSTSRSRDKLHFRHFSASTTMKPIFVDSFPKLKAWYRQHQACLASTLSGLVHGTPVHQVVDGLLNMMFRKLGKGGTPGTSTSSSLSSTSGTGSDDTSQRPMLPAWEIMEAVPFVADAALSACSHGRLTPPELATGLKSLADFLPASLATMVSYFSAEVTRGVWKPVVMNGTDWPSPAANLSSVEDEIRKIVAATGVDVPSLVVGASSPATLPLPLAALLSLTITYKLDRVSEPFLNLAGPALENLAAGCPWPSMPIVAALWTQKARRWNDYLTFSASRTIFQQNNNAVIVQLLKSCFSATLGSSSNHILSSGGADGLLGHGFVPLRTGGLSAVAPGFMYLRTYRSIRDSLFLTGEILSILIASVKDIVVSDVPKDIFKLSQYKNGMNYGRFSLSTAMSKAKLSAVLGASLLWISGSTGLVQMLFQETLPSWFLSKDASEMTKNEGKSAILVGYTLAYFCMLCGAFAWGVDSPSKRRPMILNGYFDYLANVLEGKFLLSCHLTTWRTYVFGFLGLVLGCAPKWISEMKVGTLKRLSNGLKLMGDKELAFAILERGGASSMDSAAELAILLQEHSHV